jgi:hypothetical protein
LTEKELFRIRKQVIENYATGLPIELKARIGDFKKIYYLIIRNLDSLV